MTYYVIGQAFGWTAFGRTGFLEALHGFRSAGQPFEKEAGQVTPGVEDCGDVDVEGVVPVDDPPRTLDQFAVGLHTRRSQLWNDAPPLGRGVEMPAAAFYPFQHPERIRRGILGDEPDNPLEVESRGICPSDPAISHRRTSTVP